MSIFTLFRKQSRRKEEEITFFVLKNLLDRFLNITDIQDNVKNLIILTRFADLIGSIFKVLAVIFISIKIFDINIAMFISWIYIFICKFMLDERHMNNYIRCEEYKLYKLNCNSRKSFFYGFLNYSISSKLNDLILKVFFPATIVICTNYIYLNDLRVIVFSIINLIIITILSEFIVLSLNNILISNYKSSIGDIIRKLLTLLFSALFIFASNYIYVKLYYSIIFLIITVILIINLIQGYKNELYRMNTLNYDKNKIFKVKKTKNIANIIINNHIRLFSKDGYIWKVVFFQIVTLVIGIFLSTNKLFNNITDMLLINSINMIIFITVQLIDRKVMDNINGHFFILKFYKKAKFMLLVECLINVLIYFPILIVYILLCNGHSIFYILIYYLIAIMYHTMKTRKNIYNLVKEDLISDRFTLETKVFKISIFDYVTMTGLNTLLFIYIGLGDSRILYSISMIINTVVIITYTWFLIVFFKELFFKRGNVSA